MRNILLILALLVGLALTGCAATSVAISKKDLNVQTKMSHSIFLDIESGTDRSVFVDIRNTTDKNINIKELVIAKLIEKGYRIETVPANAGYVLQVNVLQVGMIDPNAFEASLMAGGGMGTAAAIGAGAGAGAVVGSSLGGYRSTLGGAAIGGAALGLADLIANSAVKDVTYSMITRVMVSEKSEKGIQEIQTSNISKGMGQRITQQSQQEVKRVRYNTRIGTMANKVNLQFEEAQPVIEEKLASVIAGIF